jgi:hypothetical protein
MNNRYVTAPYRVRHHKGGGDCPIYQSSEERRLAEGGAKTADERVATSLYMTSATIERFSPSPPNSSPISISSDSSHAAMEASISSAQQNLPLYFQPVPDRIKAEDLEYLQKKGVFSLPDCRLRDQLLEAFVEFVHGYIPVLEISSFLNGIHNEDTTAGKISLLVFYAVMFAASSCTRLEHLQNSGYSTRKEARRDFWQKTRVWRFFT